jgi:uncharacterized protein YggU (UPF0235/DUF167 family)
MMLKVKVIPNAKQNKAVSEVGRTKVYLTAPAVDLIDFLAGYFKVRKSSIRIVHGEKNREKTVEISGAKGL